MSSAGAAGPSSCAIASFSKTTSSFHWGRIAIEPLCASVPTGNHAVQGFANDRVIRGLNDRDQLRTPLLGQLAVGDIAVIDDDGLHTRLGEEVLPDGFYPPPRFILVLV